MDDSTQIASKPQNSERRMTPHLIRLFERSGVFLNSYAEIFFLQNRFAGLVLMLVTLINPNVGLAGLISISAAYLFARLIGMEAGFMGTGFHTYNALLVGLSIGYLFAIDATTLFVLATAGVLTLVLSVALSNVFSLYFRLPILSLPFVIVSSIAWLASQQYSALYVHGLYVHSEFTLNWLPVWLSGFFTALGAIVFTPHPVAGFAIAGVLLWHSRILFLLGFAGYLLGAGTTYFLGISTADPFSDIYHFNYILVAMALGGVFLVPSPRSFAIAAVGVAVSALVLSAVRLFSASFGLPAFTLPFNMVTLGFIYVLGSIGFELVAKRIQARPEDTLDDFLTQRDRFQMEQPELGLPFSGIWTVWQGFDGQWTHTGSWRHAYDFVITDRSTGGEARTHAGNGAQLTDYYAWLKPVMSPVRGRVIRVVSHLPDNPPGHVDNRNNWGNLVIIQSEFGWHVELSHFARDSILVREGDWVEPGHQLGVCGNSGYSAQPHIHMQVQSAPTVGAATTPFKLKGYLEGNIFVASGLPDEGARLERVLPDRALEYRMAIPLDTTLRYRLDSAGAALIEGSMRVCSDELGETYLADGEARLYFNQNEASFYFYRLEGRSTVLNLLYAGLPRLPLMYRRDIAWNDTIPLATMATGREKLWLELVRSLFPGYGSHRCHLAWNQSGVMQGFIRNEAASTDTPLRVSLHGKLGISEIVLGEHRLLLEPIK